MSPDPDPSPPPPLRPRGRPMLRPGLRVTRRDADTLQVGLDPGCQTTLPDRPPVRALLAALGDGDEPDLTDGAARAAWARLWDADLVVDRLRLSADLAGVSDGRRRQAISAAYAAHGKHATQRLQARAEARVAVRLPRDDARAAHWGATVTGLLRDAGVGLAPAGNDADATVALVVTGTEPARESLDPALATGEPHLLLASVEGRIRLGPFVVPGRTACLRCVDAHLDERDPRRSLVVHQYAEEQVAIGVPAPDDPALTMLALAWAVRDLVSYVEGDRPATWSATVRIEPDLGLHRHEWTRHPHCGCCWGDLLDVV
ncbi:MAG: TOMM precursor leader peptide-binding protein [Nocardioides sp.]